MSKWLISVPVWGDAYVRTFVDLAAPALLVAASRLGVRPRFIIHTNQPEGVLRALPGQDVVVRPVGSKPTYIALQESHADAVRTAAPGDRVVLLNADLVVSGNFFRQCDIHFELEGKRAVVLLGIRTVIDAMRGPDRLAPGAEPRALLAWAWAHRHQIIRDLEWPHGGSMLPTNLFFAAGGSVVARGFHLHPAAVIKHDAIAFSSTIDGDLLDYFPRESIHVVTDPDDCAMLEMSPADRRFPVRGGVSLSPERVAASMRSRASVMHCWLATHRIGVVGPTADCGDATAMEQILRSLGHPAPPERLPRGTPAGRGGRHIHAASGRLRR